MPANDEPCCENDCFAVVSDKSRQSFPDRTDRGLKNLGKAVFPVDSSMDEVEGDHAFATLECSAATGHASVLEGPKEDGRQRAPDAWRNALGAPA